VTRKAIFAAALLAALITGFVVGQFRRPARPGLARTVLYYVDPMHPAYRSSKPGVAPDCGMDLVPVYADDAGKYLVSSSKSLKGALRIDPATQKLYGIQLSKVGRTTGQETVRVFGRVAADETRVFRVNLGTDGYVKETHGDAVGNRVKKDQHLAVVYSPEFLTVAGGYLSANERAPGPMSKEAGASSQNAASAQARADRLRNLGMSDAQINELSVTRKVPEDVYVVAPTDGFILSRGISPGLRFERHTDLYTIADLSHVWVIVEVFGTEAQAFLPGTVVRAILPDTGEGFAATVSNVLPQVDPSTRALKVRLEVDNVGFKLRPDMYVNVEMRAASHAGLSVPSDAVVDTGLSRRVFVQISEGYFEPRDVETGRRSQDRVEIVKGLREGEEIASAGAFLIDSESRMHATAQPREMVQATRLK
jgi:Cu(I)/Ag(I) efflux system membrane fusion protein